MFLYSPMFTYITEYGRGPVLGPYSRNIYWDSTVYADENLQTIGCPGDGIWSLLCGSVTEQPWELPETSDCVSVRAADKAPWTRTCEGHYVLDLRKLSSFRSFILMYLQICWVICLACVGFQFYVRRWLGDCLCANVFFKDDWNVSNLQIFSIYIVHSNSFV